MLAVPAACRYGRVEGLRPGGQSKWSVRADTPLAVRMVDCDTRVSLARSPATAACHPVGTVTRRRLLGFCSRGQDPRGKMNGRFF